MRKMQNTTKVETLVIDKTALSNKVTVGKKRQNFRIIKI